MTDTAPRWICQPQTAEGLPMSPESRGCGHVWTDESEPTICPACGNHLSAIVPVENTPHDYEAAADALAELAKREGLTIAATFVPLSQSRNAKPGKDGKIWRSLNWRVDLLRQGRDVNTLAPAGPVHVIIAATDYAQGEAHAPAHKLTGEKLKAAAARYGRPERTTKAAMIDHEIETGRVAKNQMFGGEALMSGAPIPPPSIVDVLSALLLDAGAIEYAKFEDWAGDYGYDADSREAEAAYRACLAHGLALRASLGNDVFTEARDLATSL